MFEKLRKAFQNIIEILSTTSLSERDIEAHESDILFELVEADVSVEAIEEIIRLMKLECRNVTKQRFQNSEQAVRKLLELTIRRLFEQAGEYDILEGVKLKKKMGEPYVTMFVGPNGHGKTTTIVKISKMLKDNGLSSVIAASDTFRAGAIEQLEELAKRVKVRVIAQGYGADPAAVAYDAIIHARSKRINAVLIDTSGRLETDIGLMEEMKKIHRVSKPDAVIFVGDALMGGDAYEMSLKFHQNVPLTASILTKMDADTKGGAAISIVVATHRPIAYIGTGQGLDDIKKFDVNEYLIRLGIS